MLFSMSHALWAGPLLGPGIWGVRKARQQQLNGPQTLWIYIPFERVIGGQTRTGVVFPFHHEQVDMGFARERGRKSQ